MAAPPGKRLVTLEDGRTIAVSEEDARRFEFFSQDGKVMRRPRPPAAAPPPRAAGPPPARPQAPAAPAAPPPAPRPQAPPPAQRVAPPPPAAAAPLRPAPQGPRMGRPGGRRPSGGRRVPRTPPPVLARPAALGYNARVVIVTALFAGLVFSPWTLPTFQSYGPFIQQVLDFDPSTFNQRTFPRIAEFDLTRLISIEARGATIDYHLTISRPETIPNLQDVLSIQASPPATNQGSRLVWDRQVPLGSTETVNVTYHVRMTTHEWVLKNSEVAAASAVPQSYKNVYLDQEYKINPNDQAVRQLADSITNRSDPVLEQLDEMYTWLLKQYTYQRSPSYEPKDPEVTMADRGGDCDDFSVLFISMARYLGIPAWLELGLLYDEFRNEWGPHGWATVAIPLTNGSVVEVTIDVVNKLFLIRDPYHFSDWSSDGDAQNLEDYYTLLSYQPVGPVSQTPPVAVTQQIFNGPMTTTGTLNYFHG